MKLLFCRNRNSQTFWNSMGHLRNVLMVLTGVSLCVLYVMYSVNAKGEMFSPFYSLSLNETNKICSVIYEDNRKHLFKSENALPTIYFVTPTYPRREQFAELTRLGQTLMHIENLHWIVADDNEICDIALGKLLRKFGIPFTHLSSPMPHMYRNSLSSPRGVSNRRAALTWIKTNNIRNGVLYFGDDDNTFDLALFSEIRFTKKVSMFPVGLIGLYAVSTPVVRYGKVVGFFDSWPGKRKWPVDMAGFAVSLEFLALSPNATMPYQEGHEEDGFLRSLGLHMTDIEPKASNCREILVWHTQTKKIKAPVIKTTSQSLELEHNSLLSLLQNIDGMGMASLSSNAGEPVKITKDGKTHEIFL